MTESTGQRLRKLRLEKGISLEEVHKKTKIHSGILKAIEEDSLVNFSPVYIKGFIKIYCKFLGVDSRDYVSDNKDTPRVIQPEEKKEEKPASFLSAKPQKLIPFEVNWGKAKKISLVILAFIMVWIILFNLGKVFSRKRKIAPKIRKPPVSAALKSETKSEDKAEKVKADTQALGVSNVLRLGIRARDDCWVQLKIDGHVVFQNILKRGRSESWQAKEKIELSLGNAGGVDLEVNGKLIPSLGKKGQSLKNILITKEGLIAGR